MNKAQGGEWQTDKKAATRIMPRSGCKNSGHCAVKGIHGAVKGIHGAVTWVRGFLKIWR